MTNLVQLDVHPTLGASQRRIVEHLKRGGSSTIPSLAAKLDLSVETIRSHLKGLNRAGLVERQGRRRSGPGRPEIIFGLTDAAETLFPSQEGALLQDLATYLEREGHGDLVRRFFDAQVARRRAAVLARLEGLDDAARLDEVARVLSEEGFMAEVVVDESGEKRLRLCHCPMRHLVAVTKAPCRAELRFVREMLGTRLARVAYIPAGDDACCYAVGGGEGTA